MGFHCRVRNAGDIAFQVLRGNRADREGGKLRFLGELAQGNVRRITLYVFCWRVAAILNDFCVDDLPAGFLGKANFHVFQAFHDEILKSAVKIYRIPLKTSSVSLNFCPISRLCFSNFLPKIPQNQSLTSNSPFSPRRSLSFSPPFDPTSISPIPKIPLYLGKNGRKIRLTVREIFCVYI